MWQEIATFTIVALAVGYLLNKLVFAPAMRGRKPDVPTSALVRRKKAARDPACH